MRSAIGSVAETLPVVKKWGCTHYAVTNYGEISGWVQQYFGAVKEGIVPVLGMEVCLNNYKPESSEGEKNHEAKVLCHSTTEVTSRPLKDLTPEEKSEVNYNFHMVVLAADETGYTNLIRLHNEAQLNWFFMRPRIHDSFLRDNGKGLIAISPYQNGDVWVLLDNKLEEQALQRCRFYQAAFEGFYLEVALLDDERCARNAERIIAFAQKYDIPMVVTLNSHYVHPDEEDTFGALMEVGTRDGVLDVTYKTGGMHLRTREQVDDLYRSLYKGEVFTEAVYAACHANVQAICDRIKTVKIDTRPKLPKFDNSNEVLTAKAKTGLVRRCKSEDPVYIQRLDYELMNVVKAGFADYFLFLEDLVAWCRDNGVLVGPGRGSAGGCLILYSLNVTQVDPIRWNLLFERFLDAARLDDVVSKGGKITGDDLPDVDMDFSDRDRVVAYLRGKYGESLTCEIGTVGRMKLKKTLIDLSRAAGIPMEEVYEVTKGEMHEYGKEEEEMDLETLKQETPALAAFLQKHPEVETHMQRLRNTISFWGRHAGGVLVCGEPITDSLPLRRIEEHVVSCWDEGLAGRNLGKMGFIKMDILGVETITQIQDTIELVQKTRGQHLDMYSLPLEDDRAMKLCNEGENLGVFQFDGYSSRQVISAMGGIRCFLDYAHASALMRPSSLQANLHSKFGKRRDKLEGEKYTIPTCLQETLGPTYGLTVYQESAYHVARHLSGFGIVDAYKFMKLLYKGKMTPEVTPKWRDKFMAGAQPKVDSGEVTQAVVDGLFDDLLKFQGYGFCAAHATAYAVLSAWTLYLKAHYFAEFMCCLLRRTPRNKEDKRGVSIFEHRVKYAQRNRVKVFGPSINRSAVDFGIDEGGIRYGLSAIKGVASAADEIVAHQPYASFQDFLARVNARVVHKGRVESLVFAGAFDEFADRETIWNQHRKACEDKAKGGKKKDTSTGDIFSALMGPESAKDVMAALAEEEDQAHRCFTEGELLDQERDMLGVVLSSNLLMKHAGMIEKEGLRTIGEALERRLKCPTFLARVTSVATFISKRQNVTYYKLGLDDGVNNVTMMTGASLYSSNETRLKQGNVVILSGNFDGSGKPECWLNEKVEVRVVERKTP